MDWRPFARMSLSIRVGTAGWSIPHALQDDFPEGGSHLTRYAARLPMAEINSSFHRPHRRQTYERWAASVGRDFRFAVKIPKAITHVGRLVDVDEPLRRFAGEIAGLGEKLGPVLVQLPPSLVFEPRVVDAFARQLRAVIPAQTVIEPRHPSWFADDADLLLAGHRIARVAADPPPVPVAAAPGGWRDWRISACTARRPSIAPIIRQRRSRFTSQRRQAPPARPILYGSSMTIQPRAPPPETRSNSRICSRDVGALNTKERPSVFLTVYVPRSHSARSE